MGLRDKLMDFWTIMKYNLYYRNFFYVIDGECITYNFDLLITIIVLAIIIAVIYNCKIETFDLGKYISNPKS